jgi:hypothetical protein
MRVREPPGRGDTRRAAPDDYDLSIAAGHGLFCGGSDREGRFDRATHHVIF